MSRIVHLTLFIVLYIWNNLYNHILITKSSYFFSVHSLQVFFLVFTLDLNMYIYKDLLLVTYESNGLFLYVAGQCDKALTI